MRKSTLALAALALVAVALAIPALSLAGANTHVSTKLKGKNEVPGPGDPNGKGEFAATIKPAKRKLCFTLELAKLDGAMAGHIHKGATDVAGPVKVTLFDQEIGGTGNYEGCVKKIKGKLLKRIAANPEKFYVNVHNAKYPDGAIRGQLELAS